MTGVIRNPPPTPPALENPTMSISTSIPSISYRVTGFSSCL